MRRWLWSLAAVLMVAPACGTGESAEPSLSMPTDTTLVAESGPSKGATRSVPPTTADPIVAAREAYLAAADRLGGVIAMTEEARGPDGLMSWADSVEQCQVLAPAFDEFATELQTFDWPADVQDEIDAVVRSVLSEMVIMQDCAQLDPSDTDALRDIEMQRQALAGEHESAVRNIRLALGIIPPASTEAPVPAETPAVLAAADRVELPAAGCDLTADPTDAIAPAVEIPAWSLGDVRWTAKAPTEIGSASPAVNGVVVVLGEGDGTVARDLSDGSETWRRQIGARPVAIADGAPLVVGSMEDVESGGTTFTALLADTGDVDWTSPEIPGRARAILVAEGAVVAGFDDLVVALNSQTGNPRWWTRARLAGVSGDDTMVYREGSCTVDLIDNTSGQVRWSAPTPRTFQLGDVAQTVVSGGELYVVVQPIAPELFLGMLDAATGEIRWWRRIPVQVANFGAGADVAIVGSTVFLTVPASGADGSTLSVFAFDTSTGATTWAFEASLAQGGHRYSNALESMVVAAGGLLEVSSGDQLFQIEQNGGAVRAVVDLGETLNQVAETEWRDWMSAFVTVDGTFVIVGDEVALIGVPS